MCTTSLFALSASEGGNCPLPRLHRLWIWTYQT